MHTYYKTETVDYNGSQVEVKVYKNSCDCHSETCSHWNYRFKLQNGKLWGGDSYYEYQCIQHARD
jgi:hypothetical protein